MSDTTDRTENQDIQREEDLKAAQEKYLADSEHCPYCGNEWIFDASEEQDMVESIGVDLLGGKDIDLLMECGGCENQWRNVYRTKLHDIYFGDELDPLSVADKARK